MCAGGVIVIKVWVGLANVLSSEVGKVNVLCVGAGAKNFCDVLATGNWDELVIRKTTVQV